MPYICTISDRYRRKAILQAQYVDLTSDISSLGHPITSLFQSRFKLLEYPTD